MCHPPSSVIISPEVGWGRGLVDVGTLRSEPGQKKCSPPDSMEWEVVAEDVCVGEGGCVGSTDCLLLRPPRL